MNTIHPERLMPTKFFLVGIALMVFGCASSLYFSKNMKGFKIIGDIGEIWPLILGAALGGNYCSEAILGQKFKGVLQKIKPLNALLGVAFIIGALLLVTQKANITTISWTLGIGLSPLFALFILNSTKDELNEYDTPIMMLIVGFGMIVITILGTYYLLGEINDATDSFTFVKNLVPVYSGSIGAALILRAIAENIPPFKLKKWTKKYFKRKVDPEFETLI